MSGVVNARAASRHRSVPLGRRGLRRRLRVSRHGPDPAVASSARRSVGTDQLSAERPDRDHEDHVPGQRAAPIASTTGSTARGGSCRPTRSDFQNRAIYRGTGDGAAGAARLQPRVVGDREAHEPLDLRTSSSTTRRCSTTSTRGGQATPSSSGATTRTACRGRTTKSLTHGLDWTHTLGPKTYFTLAVRQNYFDYQDRVYDDLYDSRYDAGRARRPATPTTRTGAHRHPGRLARRRFRQETNALVSQGRRGVPVSAATSRSRPALEFQWPTMRFGSMGYIVSRRS